MAYSLDFRKKVITYCDKLAIFPKYLLFSKFRTTPFPKIIGNKEYLSKDLKSKLTQISITFTTSLRKNMNETDKIGR